MHKDNVVHIGEIIGKLNYIDDCEDLVLCGIGYICCNMHIDISKPLPASFYKKCDGTGSWIQFQYERLPEFCYMVRWSIKPCHVQKV